MYVLFVVIFINLCKADDAPLVNTPLGDIAGSWRKSFDGRRFAAFEGIPYAKPPIGELRFEAAVPVEPWKRKFDALQTHICIQNFLESIIGSEDCLYLNVYIPTESIGKNNFSVVVFIHEGAFKAQHGHVSDPQYIMDSELVYVTINYRLGPFGFISTEDDVLPGNLGLKDQVQALKWIQTYIMYFGGNPNSVTLAGLSAGAASVHLHYMSPLSRGLFHRGIAHGGTALNPWVQKENPTVQALKMASLTNCPTSPSKELKACLKSRPAVDILRNMDHFYEYAGHPIAPFGLVVEHVSTGGFITECPYKLLRRGEIFDAPFIISSTPQEGIIFGAGLYDKLEEIDQEWSLVAHAILDYNDTLPVSQRADVARKIKEFYVGKGGRFSRDTFSNFVEMLTHRYTLTANEISAKLQSSVNKSPVYYYVFNYAGENRLLELYYGRGDLADGVTHIEDSLYFYGDMVVKKLSEFDIKVMKLCQRMLYTFASTGVPAVGEAIDWPPVSGTKLTFLRINDSNNFTVETVDELSPIEFWNSLGILENDNSF